MTRTKKHTAIYASLGLVMLLLSSGCVVHTRTPAPPPARVAVVATTPAPPPRVVVRPAPRPRRVVVRPAPRRAPVVRVHVRRR